MYHIHFQGDTFSETQMLVPRNDPTASPDLGQYSQQESGGRCETYMAFGLFRVVSSSSPLKLKVIYTFTSEASSEASVLSDESLEGSDMSIQVIAESLSLVKGSDRGDRPRLLLPASNTREQWHAGNARRLTAGAEDRQVSLAHSAWTSESPVFVGVNLKCNIMVEFYSSLPLLQKMVWQLLDCYSDSTSRRAWSWHVASGSWKEGQGGGSGMREEEEEERPLRSMTAREKSKMYRAVSSTATPNKLDNIYFMSRAVSSIATANNLTIFNCSEGTYRSPRVMNGSLNASACAKCTLRQVRRSYGCFDVH